MSLKSAALFSLFSGVSFTDVQRAATRHTPRSRGSSPTAEDIAHATRFAGPAQVSTGLPAPGVGQSMETLPLLDAA